jgi:hypothetical protein
MVKKKATESYDLCQVTNLLVTNLIFYHLADKKPAHEGNEGLTYLLRHTKKLMPTFKNKHVHSVLPSVEVATAGAYNPSVDDYTVIALKSFIILGSFLELCEQNRCRGGCRNCKGRTGEARIDTETRRDLLHTGML